MKDEREQERMTKLSGAIAAGLVLVAGVAVSSMPAMAMKATGTASVTIVAPLSVTEVSSSSFDYEHTIKTGDAGDASSTLIVRGSPHTQPITARSHSDPITWGEFTISGRNYAQISVSAIENSPAAIAFSKEKANYGDTQLQVGGTTTTPVDLSQPQTLKLSSAIAVNDSHLSGRFQPTYTVALHYE